MISSADLTATVNDLPSGTVFNVTVYAVNEVGVSLPSTPITASTAIDLLSVIRTWIMANLTLFIVIVVCGSLVIIGLVVLLACCVSRRKRNQKTRQHFHLAAEEMTDLK